MKNRLLVALATTAAVAAALAASVPALAQGMTSQTAPTYSTPASPAVLPPGDVMRTDDLELARHVVNAINGDPQFAHSSITVVAREGNVYLRGSVDAPDLLNRAEAIASHIAGGAHWVHDQLRAGRG